MGRLSRILVLTAIVCSAAGVAVAVKLHHLQSGVVSSGKTEVQLSLTVRGTGGRPVKNAKVSVFDPDQITLGRTNDTGQLSVKEFLTSGRSLVIQVDGIAFQMQRTILIPRSLTYKSSVFFDLAEVHEGNATLLSTADTETASLMPVPQPTPEIPPAALVLDTQKMISAQEQKTKFAELANLAALKEPRAAQSTASCQSLNLPNPVFECELSTSAGYTASRLFAAIPANEADAKLWLESFFEKTPEKFSKSLMKNELVFNVRHHNQKYKAYFGTKPASVWKTKRDSHLLRVQLAEKAKDAGQNELTLILEDGRILQRKIRQPLNKKFFTVRIPASGRLDLSKR